MWKGLSSFFSVASQLFNDWVISAALHSFLRYPSCSGRKAIISEEEKSKSKWDLKLTSVHLLWGCHFWEIWFLCLPSVCVWWGEWETAHTGSGVWTLGPSWRRYLGRCRMCSLAGHSLWEYAALSHSSSLWVFHAVVEDVVPHIFLVWFPTTMLSSPWRTLIPWNHKP